jgi:energy-coupling factor transport system substrate-specific component
MKTQAMTSKISLALTALASIFIFIWPLIIGAAQQDQATLAQGVFIALMPLLILLTLVEFASGELDSRRIALLGVLTALNAVIRLLGAGVSGIETAFFIIILGGYVFGVGFGFILGTASLLVSAVLGAGVGPWLPFQMMAAGLVGLGAGAVGALDSLISQRASFSGHRSKFRFVRERVLLVTYSIAASLFYGAMMTMWNWPFLAGTGSSVSYLAGAPVVENLSRFIKYELFTGGLVWDLGRAATTTALILITGPALLATLRRAANKAGFN